MKYIYTLDGEIEQDEKEENMFVKMICATSSHLEKTIARILKDNPMPNIVNIYNIADNYIEMELLDVDIESHTLALTYKWKLPNISASKQF
jgi:hypothetical protein